MFLPHGAANTASAFSVQAIMIAIAALTISSPVGAQSRGELLYSTHCIACHTTEVHWREKSLVTDWVSLKVQVRRWQDAASLKWSEADIQEVTRYLNTSIYRFDRTTDPSTSPRAGLPDRGLR